MELSEKKIGVIGLGKSGHGLIDYLETRAKAVMAFDFNKELEKNYKAEEYKNTKFHFGVNPKGDEDLDMIILSPGISLENEFVVKFQKRGLEIIGEVELAFRQAKGSFVGITGTNGKTTTTALLGQIFTNAGYDTRLVGNIGKPIISETDSSDEKTVFITELSSFQLETIKEFTCRAATIINIAPDHLDRHHSLENYINAKARIFENQTDGDYAIINLEDPVSLSLSDHFPSKKIYFSVNKKEDAETRENSIYIVEDQIFCKRADKIQRLMDTSEIYIRGKHNLENALAAVGLALAYEIDLEIIAKTLRAFRGVEHRLEFVKTINGVDYINDSKGTNPEASIKALEAMGEDIILIAGGYDKESDFSEFVSEFREKVKHAFILGATREKLKKAFEVASFKDYTEVESIEEALQIAYKMAKKGDKVLLSPACASWGMYDNFEQRGEDFKKIVDKLG